MTKRARESRTLKFCALMAGLLLTLFLVWPAECLVGQCEGKRLFAWPIRAGEAFEITFTHSLNLSPITDVIVWTGSDLSVVKSRFKTFGAGVPVPADGIGTKIVKVGEYYELIGIDQHMQTLTILTQTVPNHHIAFRGREASLLALAGSGKAVDIAVKRIPWLLRL